MTCESESYITCPGCGVCLPNQQLAPSDRFHASGECWQLFCQLSAETGSRYDEEFIHQMAIDTYEAQHGGGTAKIIATIFGLVGLYLALEHNYSGKEVQKAHMTLARRFKNWPRLEPPARIWDMTIGEVIQAKSHEEQKEKIRSWANTTWKAWHKDHAVIIRLVDQYLFSS